MKKRILFFMVFLMISFSIFASVEDTLKKARQDVEELLSKSDSGAFVQLLEMSEGIVIFPTFYKFGYIFGGQFGEGIVLRKDSATGEWYGPSFVNIYGLSWGAQVGIQSAALILVVMNEKGMDGFMGDNFTLGGSVGISAGPLGRQLSADIDYKLQASIYSYSIARGFYAGMAIEGAYIKADMISNEAYYQEPLTPEQILKEKKVTGEAKKIVELIEKAILNKQLENKDEI